MGYKITGIAGLNRTPLTNTFQRQNEVIQLPPFLLVHLSSDDVTVNAPNSPLIFWLGLGFYQNGIFAIANYRAPTAAVFSKFEHKNIHVKVKIQIE